MHLICTFLITSLLFVTPLWAEPFSENSLPDITVVDTSAITTPGSSVLDRQTLQSLPQGDGAITDLLKVLPGIQFSETDNSSLTGGEILPAEISISGGRIYDNNFMIDGVNNNSLIDPTYYGFNDADEVPGHSQELFLDSSLLESIWVQRSNISARYSGFTGGVVEMETRNPANDFGGEFGYRSTRSEWTSYHVERENREDFETSDDYRKQPEFRKQFGYLNLDIPLNEEMGLLIAYSQSHSKIPLNLLGETVDQYRKSENMFVKYRFRPNDEIDFIFSTLWTPYEGEYFIKNTRNSHFTVEGGGLAFNANLKKKSGFGDIELVASWRCSENSRNSPTDFHYWDKDVESTNWGDGFSSTSQEGGVGSVDNEQTSLTTAAHVTFNPLYLAKIEHSVAAGITVERSQAKYYRPATSVQSFWKDDPAVVCEDGDLFCVEGEQYSYRRTEYEKAHSSAEMTAYDLYVEDVMKLKNITFVPGLHVGYNDLMKNTDYAARSVVLYDLFSDGTSVLSAGMNRYYGKSFLTYALKEDTPGRVVYTRDKVLPPSIDWNEDRNDPAKGFSRLKTPHADEWSFGLEQDMFGGRLTLAYIDRNTEDQLSRWQVKTDDGEKHYELHNNGESRHEEVTVSWERRWLKHYLLVDATWQDSQSSNENYNDTLTEEDLDEEVWYHGNLISILDLPRSDYNREWSANLIYSATLPYGFSFTNIFRYRSGYEAIGDTKENYLLDDEKIDIYDDISYSSATTFDWKIEWEYSLTEIQTMTITADITNVFNRKLYTGVEGEYQMGRQLWVGVDYSF